MKLVSFIAQRMLRNSDKGNISRPIVRIATIGIAVGVALMIISVAVVKGFQQEVRNVVVGFGSHFQVVSLEDNLKGDSSPVWYSDSLYRTLASLPEVRHVQVFASRPGILESKSALQGALLKGVDTDFDFTFLKNVLVGGEIPRFSKDSLINDILISKKVASRLELEVGSKLSAYVINANEQARQTNFTVCGIYETGLEDFDTKFTFMDIRHVRELSNWGLNAQIVVDTTCFAGFISFGAQAFGGDENYSYRWNSAEWQDEGPHALLVSKDTTLSVIVTDGMGTAADTAKVTIDFLDDNATEACRPYRIVREQKPDGFGGYIGGYEVLIRDYAQLVSADDAIYQAIPYQFQVEKITDRSPEIFAWLEMLDINVIIIIVLMVVISIVNMTSALLIIILERQQMIGTLKALGMSNAPLIRVFLLNAAAIVGKGMLWGNLLGLGFALLQSSTHFIPLDATNYYVNHVPIALDWMSFLVLDLATLVVCVITLLVPALYITTIYPIRSIRFS